MTYYTLVRRRDDSRAAKDSASRVALDRLLPLLGADTGAVLSRDGRGKPFFSELPELCVSISHAFPFTAVVLSHAPVGIDLEEMGSIRDPEGIARRFFTEEEQKAVCSSDDPCAVVLSVWVAKEAVGKYLGTGLAESLSVCSFDPPAGTALYREAISVDGVPYALCLCAHSKPAKWGD